jgi:hypothetical protein
LGSRFDPRMHAYDDQARHAGVIYVLMLVIAVAFGGFVWQLYSSPEIPRIAGPTTPYKIAPAADVAPDLAEEAMTAPEVDRAQEPPADASLAEAAAPVSSGPPQLPPSPDFVNNGPYVAQLAALQSEAAVQQAWRRLSSRAPQLFEPARLDVERADLGARGVYYRVRAGYFANRDNASLFCERIRQMGQDCIVAAR